MWTTDSSTGYETYLKDDDSTYKLKSENVHSFLTVRTLLWSNIKDNRFIPYRVIK